MRRLRPIFLFSILVCTGVVFVGALNLFYAGGIELFRGDAGIAQIVKEQIDTGKVLLTSPDFNDRIYKREMLRQRAAGIKVLVTGSSRVFLLDADIFGEILNVDRHVFFNAGMQGSTLEDHIIVWQICKEQGLSPAVFFLGLDPWVLNENSGESRWEVFDAEFRRFQYSYLETGPSLMYYLTDRFLHYYWLKATDLLGAPRLLVALQSVGHSMLDKVPAVPPGEELVLMKESAKPAERAGKRIDGSAVYPKREAEARFSGDNAKLVLGDAKAGKFYHFNEWHRLSQDRMDLLNRLLKEMQTHGVKVIGFTVPYIPDYYNILKEHKDYMRLLRQQSAFFRGSFSQFQFEYYDMLDPAVTGLTTEDFTDYIHPTRDGMGKVLRYIRDRSVIVKDGFLGLRGERQSTSRD